MRIDPAQAEAVVAVVELGSFSAAARQLHVTQPALSRRISALETSIGLRLFHRTDRVARLTAEGSALLPAIRHVVGANVDAQHAVESVRGVESGDLHVVALPSLISTDAAPIVAAFHQKYPDVGITVDAVHDVDEVIRLVSEAHCDVAISDLEFAHPALTTSPLRRTVMMAVFPPGTELSGSAEDGSIPDLTPADLVDRTLVTLPPGTLTRTLTDECYEHLDIRPRRVVTTSQRDALVSFALRGAGVTFVPDVMAEDSRAAGAVIARCDRPRPRTIGLVHRPSTGTPKLNAFLQSAHESTINRTRRRG